MRSCPGRTRWSTLTNLIVRCVYKRIISESAHQGEINNDVQCMHEGTHNATSSIFSYTKTKLTFSRIESSCVLLSLWKIFYPESLIHFDFLIRFDCTKHRHKKNIVQKRVTKIVYTWSNSRKSPEKATFNCRWPCVYASCNARVLLLISFIKCHAVHARAAWTSPELPLILTSSRVQGSFPFSAGFACACSLVICRLLV